MKVNVKSSPLAVCTRCEISINVSLLPLASFVCFEQLHRIKKKNYSPWNKNKPMILTRSPRPPTMTSSCGSCIFSISMNLLQASTVIEKHKATRNTAFTKAPSTSALAHPKVFFDHFFGDIWNIKCSLQIYFTVYDGTNEILTLTERKAITRAATSLNMWKLSATNAIELVI